MKIACHRIAEIVFRTESDLDIPHLHRPPVSLFEVPSDTPHDVLVRFCCIGEGVSPSAEGCLLSIPIHVAERLRTPVFEAFANQQETGLYYQVEQEQLILRDYRGPSLTVISRARVDGHAAGVHWAANLRTHFSAFLPRFDAMAVHSGGVLRNGRALLLVAPDEGGKTTAVQLAEGCPVLHDDQVVLRRVGGAVHAFATPFGRLTDGPNAARLGAIFFLEQGPAFSLAPVPEREMLRCLWHGHPSFLAGLPREDRVLAFDLLHTVSSQTPAFHMTFQRDFIDWAAVDRVLEAG